MLGPNGSCYGGVLLYNNWRHLGAAIYVKAFWCKVPQKWQTHVVDVQFVHRGSLGVAVFDADHEQYQLAFSISWGCYTQILRYFLPAMLDITDIFLDQKWFTCSSVTSVICQMPACGRKLPHLLNPLYITCRYKPPICYLVHTMVSTTTFQGSPALTSDLALSALTPVD